MRKERLAKIKGGEGDQRVRGGIWEGGLEGENNGLV